MGSASLVVASLLLLEEEGGGWEGIQHGFLGGWEEEGAVCPADPQPTSTASGSPLLDRSSSWTMERALPIPVLCSLMLLPLWQDFPLLTEQQAHQSNSLCNI